MADAEGLRARLLEVQREIKVAKSQYNSFGGYQYRSKEDILEAAKPLCHARGMTLTCSDEARQVGERVYIVTTAAVADAASGERIEAQGLAREPESRKGMDASQITGTASSYAGKRALGNLLALDDTADADSGPAEPETPEGPFTARCMSCGTRYQFADRAQYEAWTPTATCCPRPDWRVE